MRPFARGRQENRGSEIFWQVYMLKKGRLLRCKMDCPFPSDRHEAPSKRPALHGSGWVLEESSEMTTRVRSRNLGVICAYFTAGDCGQCTPYDCRRGHVGEKRITRAERVLRLVLGLEDRIDMPVLGIRAKESFRWPTRLGDECNLSQG